jgi:hypothetical protein
MKKLINLFIFSVLVITVSISFAGKNNFQFQIIGYHTQRQGGQILDLYIRYAMKDDVDYSNYPDYRELREIAVKYLEPTNALPVNTFWEVIAAKLAEHLMSKYPISGISTQILVYPNESGVIYEPGFHGPIYTVGDVVPLAQVVVPTESRKVFK